MLEALEFVVIFVLLERDIAGADDATLVELEWSASIWPSSTT